MAFETIRMSVADGVARVVLDRPATRNALSSAMRRELTAAVGRAAAEARVLVVTGAGPAFCSGQDLADGGIHGQIEGRFLGVGGIQLGIGLLDLIHHVLHKNAHVGLGGALLAFQLGEQPFGVMEDLGEALGLGLGGLAHAYIHDQGLGGFGQGREGVPQHAGPLAVFGLVG